MIDRTRPIRPPAELITRDDNQCATCVAAQLLYMFHGTARPTVAAIDRAITRPPGKPADTAALYYYLLQKGLRAHTITPYDRERMLREGLPYLRKFYADEWSGAFERHFSEAWLRAKRQQVPILERKYGSLVKKQARLDIRVPTLDDITAFVDAGHPVTLTMGRGRFILHQVLVTARTGGRFTVYSPSWERPSISQVVRSKLLLRWAPQEGIVAYA